MRHRSHLWNGISHYQWIELCMSWEFNWVCWSISNNTVGNFFLNVYFFLSNENGLLNYWTCPKLVQTRYALNKWWEFKSLIIYIKHKLVGLRSHQVIIDFALSYWQLYLCFYLRLHSSNILFLATPQTLNVFDTCIPELWESFLYSKHLSRQLPRATLQNAPSSFDKSSKLCK